MRTYNIAWEKVLQESLFPWWEWDIRNNTVLFSDLKAIMLGYNPADFHGCGYQKFTELIHPQDHAETMKAMEMVLYGKAKLYQADYRIRTASGDYKWYMDRGIISEADAVGKPNKIRGIVIDLGLESRKGTDIDALLSIIYKSGAVDKEDHSLITLCSGCRKVKKADTHWINLDENLTELLGEYISHSMCPQCICDLYPDLADEILNNSGQKSL